MHTSINIEKVAQVTGHKGSIFTLISKGRNHFLSAGGEGWVVEWDLANPDPGRLIARVESNVFSLFQKDDLVIAGDMNGGMHWIDLISNQTTDLQHHRKGIFDIWEDQGNIYALGGDGYLSRRPIQEPRSVESIQVSHQSLRCRTEFDESTLAIGASDGAIYLIDKLSMETKQVIQDAHTSSIFTIIYDEQSNRIWSGGRDAQIKVWDRNGAPISTIPAHMFTVNSVCFNSDRTLVFSGSRDKTIKVWDASNFQLIKVIEGIRDGGHLNSVNSLLWSPDKNYLISGSDDKSIGIWKIEKTANDII